MGTGGIIRLIDVVFILLFGFICISEINKRSRIELPRSTETPPSNPDKEQVLFVGIDSQGSYLVEDESKLIDDPQTLYLYLSNAAHAAANSGTALRVRIRSNFDAPVKYVMAAADMCDQLNIPKGIDVRRVSAN
jgi:biopolymer transport protein ExbD